VNLKYNVLAHANMLGSTFGSSTKAAAHGFDWDNIV